MGCETGVKNPKLKNVDSSAAGVSAHMATAAPAALSPKEEEPQHMGDEYTKNCEKCRPALGLQRPHRHGQSESKNVLSADLSGPH
eukprot:6401459-Lingulodinium_polyedra.AAC.1